VACCCSALGFCGVLQNALHFGTSILVSIETLELGSRAHKHQSSSNLTMAVAGGDLVVAGGGEFKNFEGRTTSYLVFICLLIASCGLMFGYDIGINGECSSWVSINCTCNLAYI